MFGRKKCTPDQEVKNGYIHWPDLTSYIIIPEEGRLFQQHVAIIFPFTEETTCNPVVSVCALIGTTLNWHYNIFGSSCNRNCHTRSEGIAFTDRITKFTIIICRTDSEQPAGDEDTCDAEAHFRETDEGGYFLHHHCKKSG